MRHCKLLSPLFEQQSLKKAAEKLRFREEGQMVVELCAVMPVMLMVSIVIMDGLSFAALSSKFDHLAAQTVLSVAGAPQGTSYDEGNAASQIQAQLQEELGDENAQVNVDAKDEGQLTNFTCQVSVTPWPLAGEAFGMHAPTLLTHSYSLATRPYVIGEL